MSVISTLSIGSLASVVVTVDSGLVVLVGDNVEVVVVSSISKAFISFLGCRFPFSSNSKI